MGCGGKDRGLKFGGEGGMQKRESELTVLAPQKEIKKRDEPLIERCGERRFRTPMGKLRCIAPKPAQW